MQMRRPLCAQVGTRGVKEAPLSSDVFPVSCTVELIPDTPSAHELAVAAPAVQRSILPIETSASMVHLLLAERSPPGTPRQNARPLGPSPAQEPRPPRMERHRR